MSVRHIITLALMGVFLLSSVPGLQAYVWCVKEEGSRALEMGKHGACDPAPSGQTNQHSHAEHAEDCCPSSAHTHKDTCELCIDVPMDAEFFKTPAPQIKKIATALYMPPWHELQWLRDLTPQLSYTQLPHPPSYTSTALLVQRTTVLII
ncbi:MAG: hypothetical protein ACOC0G_00030 [Thermodesulfobacteriota bacterium]